MIVNIKELVSRALVELDESEALLDGQMEFAYEGCDLRRQIESVVERAATAAVLTAGSSDIDECKQLPRTVRYESGVRYLDVPEDFLRFVNLKMADWQSAETGVMSEDSAMYSLRRYWERKGAAGHRPSPAVALCHGDGSRRRFEIFGSRSSTMLYGGYLPYPEVNQAGEVWLPHGLVDRTVTLIKNEIIKIRG